MSFLEGGDELSFGGHGETARRILGHPEYQEILSMHRRVRRIIFQTATVRRSVVSTCMFVYMYALHWSKLKEVLIVVVEVYELIIAEKELLHANAYVDSFFITHSLSQ